MMGTDIHLHFEQNLDGKGWKKVDIDDRLLPDDRDYNLFAFLAIDEFRGREIAPQFANRDIPEDSSAPKQDDDSDEGWYGLWGFTYAYLDEILKAPWKENDSRGCYFFIFCVYVLPRIVNSYGWISDTDKRKVRVIIGFDN